MIVMDESFAALSNISGPVLIFFENGKPVRGFVLREDEFVTSMSLLEDAIEKAGLAAFGTD